MQPTNNQLILQETKYLQKTILQNVQTKHLLTTEGVNAPKAN